MKIRRNILIVDEERINYLRLDPATISQIDHFVVIRGEEAFIIKDKSGEQNKAMPLTELETYLRQRE